MKYFLILTFSVFFLFSCSKDNNDINQIEKKYAFISIDKSTVLDIINSDESSLIYFDNVSQTFEVIEDGVVLERSETSQTMEILEVNELVVVCYGAGYHSCFGVWGTDDCGDINCNTNCHCYEIQ